MVGQVTQAEQRALDSNAALIEKRAEDEEYYRRGMSITVLRSRCDFHVSHCFVPASSSSLSLSHSFGNGEICLIEIFSLLLEALKSNSVRVI